MKFFQKFFQKRTRVIAEKSWTYTLKEQDGALVLTVVCGSVGLYEVEVVLSKEQSARYQKEGEKYLDALAVEIRDDVPRYGRGVI